jgi:Glycosyltransferase family 87
MRLVAGSGLSSGWLLERAPRPPRTAVGDLERMLCGWLPALLIIVGFGATLRAHSFAVDFHNYYWPSARDLLRGHSPFPPPTRAVVFQPHAYPAGPYPAAVAVLFVPLALLPVWLADVLFTALLIAGVFFALRLLGVRDWRCYGAAFVWAPTASAVQTANVTLLLVVGLALLWRFRDRAIVSGLVLGAAVALKLFLWPLVVWLLLTRRYVAAIWSGVVAAAITIATWAIVGFDHFREYPQVARIFSRYYETSVYTPFAFLSKLGVPSQGARAVGVAIGVLAIVAVAVAAWRHGEVLSFTLAVGAALLLSPIVWLHYFALVLVPLMILSPAFSWLWLVPAVLWLCPVGAPSAWNASLPLLVCSFVLAAAWLNRRPQSELIQAPAY